MAHNMELRTNTIKIFRRHNHMILRFLAALRRQIKPFCPHMFYESGYAHIFSVKICNSHVFAMYISHTFHIFCWTVLLQYMVTLLDVVFAIYV